ncbi:hypothetical protein BACCIP111899_01050 [Bacillus rhizoplanae]|uniref:DUF3139 domain-containing protein n=1 Tax=Bacillus rhizoplanae TaxID=2880966 RepID=A0ABM8Y896_9BACI|nr:hypothetical protein [Bacillus rhizoplanae]CAG9611878.1 hypothetical protein BACCIP111899_01050 [Bacillus rhizoplanae]
MKKSKVANITAIVTIFIVLGISIFSPYNYLKHVHAEGILQEQGIKEEFEDKNVQSVTYKGDNTYIVKTDTKEYVVIQEYYTLMNYKWKIYALEKTWE